MELYKYMPYREGFFENLLLSFTELEMFNDPFEGGIKLSSIIDLLSSDGNYSKTLEALKKKGKVNPHPNLVALSLSKSKHSLLMWAHYAQNHEGIIVGLDTSHPFFNQTIKPDKTSAEDTSFLGKVLSVTYDRVRPDFKLGLNFSEAILSKSDEWMYEKEYRMFLRKSDRNELGRDKEGKILNHVNLFRIPASSIVRIIIGVRSNYLKIISDFKKAILTNKELSNVQLEKAELHKDLYHIIHKTIQL